ncbi:vWA domain-containing protein [Microbacterium foliorum]|uniref:vWA domain-containing protein n=1 Tax=Microbacterium foliorum TaxID=104336 RepID=UPI0028D687CB|nr:vWA domain-containing protein [Microbacterium foliorum]
MPGLIGENPAHLRPVDARVGHLREPAPLSIDGSRRRRLIGAGTALALVAGALIGWHLLDTPAEIDDVALAGHRSPAAIDVVLLLDESGSFADYAAVREEAISQLTRWAPDNLRPQDTITIIGFADDAVVRLPTATVGSLGAGAPSLIGDPVDGGGTSIRPALEQAVSSIAATGGERTIIAITDTVVDDADGASIGVLVERLHAGTMTVITPSGTGVGSGWRDAFAWETELSADPGSAGSTSLAIAEALAHATGQAVERR